MLAHGIDIVEVPRIAEMVARHGQRFLDRVFTPGEQAYAGDGRRRNEHLAARFAAKEAVLKALGTGWRSGIAWTDVEVVSLASGQPSVHLHGQAAKVAAELNISQWSLSLSHTPGFAAASVVAVRNSERESE